MRPLSPPPPLFRNTLLKVMDHNTLPSNELEELWGCLLEEGMLLEER